MGWVIPVGTPGGICSGFGEVPDGCGIVRLGGGMLALEPNPYRLWQAAAAAPQRGDLIEWALAESIQDPEALIQTLEEAGLLIEERSGVEDRVGRLAIRLAGECHGNGGERGAEFTVIGRNGAALKVDLHFFEILLRSDGVSPVSILCNGLDRAQPELDHPPCLEALVVGLPLLVRNGIVRLDLAVQ